MFNDAKGYLYLYLVRRTLKFLLYDYLSLYLEVKGGLNYTFYVDADADSEYLHTLASIIS